MAQNKVVNDPRQKTITSFFSTYKGPLKLECKNIITSAENEMLLKKYRSKTKKQWKIEREAVNNSDIHYIKLENLKTNDENPLSPNIIFRTEIGSTKYLNSKENISSEICCESKIYEMSPSKKQRLEMNELTVTKSNIQSKEIQNKISQTLQMTQSSIFDNTTSAIKNDINTDSSFLSYIENATSLENIGLENILEVELLEENDDLRKITSHIELVNDIIENTMRSHLSMLLFDEEKYVLKDFQELTIHQKYFSCKLFTHQIRWYNNFKFAESINLNITKLEIQQIIKYLEEKLILITDFSSESIISLLNLFTLDQVKDVHNTLKLKTKQKKKSALIDSVLEFINKQTTLHPNISLDKKVRLIIHSKLGEMIQINPIFYNAFYKVHLLYTFTNLEIEIPSGLYFKMREIKYGNVLYPDYKCTNEVVFENAKEFFNFYKASSYKAEVLQIVEKKGNLKFSAMFNLGKEIMKEFGNILMNSIVIESKPTFLNRFTAGHQYASALTILCKHLSSKYPLEITEWLKMLLKQTYFCQKNRGLWYSQLSLIYNAHLKETDKAIEILIDGLKDEKVSLVDRSNMVYRGRSYCKNKKKKTEELTKYLSLWGEKIPYAESFPFIIIKALGNEQSEITRNGDYKYIDKNGDITYMNVEQIAIMYYKDEESFTEGIHCEGALIHIIFYVLFWDVIYTDDIPYSFICKMQYLPLDFYSEEFYTNRKEKIDKRISDIKYDWSLEYLKSYIIERWNSISEIQHLISPGYIRNGENMYHIINCTGRSAIGDICQRLMQNFRDYRSGIPDLFVYNESSCKFVEVKGPGDKLSPKQKLWIHFLISIGINAEVCHVSKKGCSRGIIKR